MTEQNLTRGILLQKNLKLVNTVIEFFKIGKISFTDQYSYFIPILENFPLFFLHHLHRTRKKTRFNQRFLYKISHPQFLRW